MIIYGSRNKELANEHLADKCHNCGTQNSVVLHLFQRYAHVFWIPFFPIGKTGVSQCSHCKQVLKGKEMPPPLRASYENLKAHTRIPVWTFSGSVLLAILIITAIISDRKNDERNAKLILAPQSGDIFEIKIKNNGYTLYRVEEVKGDSVFVQANNYGTSKITGLDDLKNKGYSAEVFGFSKSELKQMLDKGEIVNIDRE